MNADSKWIKCSDRLPEKSGKYLVFTVMLSPHVAEYSAIMKIFGIDSIKITHWQELPDDPPEHETE